MVVRGDFVSVEEGVSKYVFLVEEFGMHTTILNRMMAYLKVFSITWQIRHDREIAVK
jgi:hypothetical protein